MRFVLTGEWLWDFHEEPLAAALEERGHSVLRFPWKGHFWHGRKGLDFLLGKIQHRLLWGPAMAQMNRDLIEKCREFRADVLFTYRGTHVLPSTLRALRQAAPGITLVGYNNDDPYSEKAERLHWRHFLQALPEYDLALAYRLHNVEDFRRAGARNARLLRSWYFPERNFPLEPSAEEKSRFGADVLFVGHYEPDYRVEAIRQLIQSGLDFKLFGPEWEERAPRIPEIDRFRPIRSLYGPDYNTAINCGKILLCFLSKLNRDTYTRRCFEIPAARRFLLAEYSDDLATLFKEGEEAEFFRSPEELVSKARHYLAHPEKIGAIAERGYQRVLRDGHDVRARARELESWITEIRSRKGA